MTNPASPGGDERPPPAYETTRGSSRPRRTTRSRPRRRWASHQQGGASALTPEADYALAPNPTDAGPLAQVKAFAAEKPAAFLGAALAAGWLLGKITSRGKRRSASDDD